MSVSIRASSKGGGVGNAVAGVPVGTTSGDLLFAVVMSDSITITTPSGWSVVGSVTNAAPYGMFWVTKIAGTESGSYTFSNSIASDISVVVYALAGSTTTPTIVVVNAQDNGNSASCVSPSVAGAGSLEVCVFASNGSQGSITLDAALTPDQTVTGSGCGLAAGHIVSPSNPTGTHTTTLGMSQSNMGLTAVFTDQPFVDTEGDPTPMFLSYQMDMRRTCAQAFPKLPDDEVALPGTIQEEEAGVVYVPVISW